jgi:hypothetical protein
MYRLWLEFFTVDPVCNAYFRTIRARRFSRAGSGQLVIS